MENELLSKSYVLFCLQSSANNVWELLQNGYKTVTNPASVPSPAVYIQVLRQEFPAQSRKIQSQYLCGAVSYEGVRFAAQRRSRATRYVAKATTQASAVV